MAQLPLWYKRAAALPLYSWMHDDETPRKLTERTGKHLCVRCLAETPAEEYLRNDHICDDCAQSDEYPLKSTPDAKKKG